MMNRESYVFNRYQIMQVQSIVQQLLEVVCLHRRAKLVCSVRYGPTPDGDRHRTGTSQKHALNGQTGYYRIGTFTPNGCSTQDLCRLFRPARCC